MEFKNKILSIIITILVLVPALGININTHICGQTEDVSKSLIIPGVLGPKECDKCHNVIVVIKSCCSNKEAVDEKTNVDNNNSEKGCCQDILEYNEFNYLTITTYVQNIDLSIVSFIVSEAYSTLRIETPIYKTMNLDTRRRPYVIDIHSFNCSYLI